MDTHTVWKKGSRKTRPRHRTVLIEYVQQSPSLLHCLIAQLSLTKIDQCGNVGKRAGQEVPTE